jgi:hypothetical protein
MVELGTLLCVVIVGLNAYRQAVATGIWSWPAFGWTMLAMLVWVAAIIVSGTWVPRIVGWDHKGLILAGILVPLVVGAVPVFVIANRLNPNRPEHKK